MTMTEIPKPSLYLETSIVSYLTAWPSHDLIRAAHQQVTRDWWVMRSSFELYISQFMIMARKDPIIEEIHAVRDDLARAADYDLERMLEAARERQAASGVKAVRLPSRKAEPVKKAS